MNSNFFSQFQTLNQSGQPFVVATVVRAEKPTSAKEVAKVIAVCGGVSTDFVVVI
jgi:xanthine/CO dehydrogenase XdhC/CoxF family maturation factor